jgi:ParB/RepB/Spo0J family partition protein
LVVWQNDPQADGTCGTIKKMPKTEDGVNGRGTPPGQNRAPLAVQNILVDRIRPEQGLDRKRDREGHRDLQRSIEQFGVLTPITVRKAPDRSGDYLLIKGQGRTLACRLLGIKTIPAIVLDKRYAESEKVQQFLVENVARLKMRPIDRALLVHRARQSGEETADISRRFGLSAATVRRLLVQLDGATTSEVAALKTGKVSLAVHSAVARHVSPPDRNRALEIAAQSALKAKDVEALFVALGWSALEDLGWRHRTQRLRLLEWACNTLTRLPPGPIRDRLHHLALDLPTELDQRSTLLAQIAP